MTRLAFVLLIASACSSSEARDTTSTEPTAAAKPVEAAPKAQPAPAPAAAPTAPAAATAAPAAPAVAKIEPLPLTSGNSFTKIGLRTMEKMANAIDAAGTDCVELARNLTPLAKDVQKAIDALGANGQQFKTLHRSRALRDRQKAQRAFIKSCKTSEPLAKTAINRSIGVIQEYDEGYGGDRIGEVW